MDRHLIREERDALQLPDGTRQQRLGIRHLRPDGNAVCRGARLGTQREVRAHLEKTVKRLNTEYTTGTNRSWRSMAINRKKSMVK